MKKVFITGGNGFIGRYITSDLLKLNYKVYVYDLLPPKIKQKGVTYVVGTILDKENMVKIAKGCDLIIHLAAIVGVKFVKKPDDGKMKGLAFIEDPDGYWIEILQANMIEKNSS